MKWVEISGREIFAHKGYSGTSVREIVAAAGVTKPGSAKPIGEERGQRGGKGP